MLSQEANIKTLQKGTLAKKAFRKCPYSTGVHIPIHAKFSWHPLPDGRWKRLYGSFEAYK
jgi:hypothetical protein